MEIDPKGPEDGDFPVNHGGSTQSIRLSSVFRNVRWWSDTHPGHEMIVLGFQGGIDTGEESMGLFRDLLREFFEDPSPLTDAGPLFSLEDWVAGMTAALDQDVIDAVSELTSRSRRRDFP